MSTENQNRLNFCPVAKIPGYNGIFFLTLYKIIALVVYLLKISHAAFYRN